MLKTEYPEKLEDPKIQKLLNGLKTTEEILNLNDLIFEQSKESLRNNQQLKTYDKKTILKLLQYQKKHDFSTSYMSRHYKISRTTIAKWRKMFESELEDVKTKR